MYGYEEKMFSQDVIVSSMNGFLLAVDDLVAAGQVELENYHVVVIGTATLMYEGVCDLVETDDVDVYSCCLPTSVKALFGDFLMNEKSRTFGAALPYNYEDRLVEMACSKHCRFLRPSWEDLVFSKLPRYSDVDKADLKALADRDLLDWEQLRHLVTDPEEACGGGIVRHVYQELLISYNDFAEQYGENALDSAEIATFIENAW